uniref:Uncharacterized protein n=1 Tax=Brassica oleracea var. oleracea TaxID=109376 RepID=A0A0D3ECS2_BRAOL
MESQHCNKHLQIVAPLPFRADINEEASESSGSMSSASYAPINPSGFQLGPSTEGRVTGSVGVTKTQRRCPHAWKRRNAGKDLKLIYPQKNAVDLVPPITKVHNLIFGRTWVDSPGEMVMTNLTTLITR